ncbi:MAG: hypothetical protein AB1505_29035 [Candidatus Latescibacterota bacterium]
MQVRALKLQDVTFGDQWFAQIEDRWEYQDFRRDRAWRQGWISMDSLLYDAADDRVYLGITSFDADIFRAYDRRAGAFVDLGYRRVADPFDAKFHRSLAKWDRDGCIYGAIALLHDVDRFWEAPGGAIVRYEPGSGALQKVAVPLPHLYIQSICLDGQRGVVYGFTFTPERLFRYHLASGRTDDLGPIGSGLAMAQGENVVLDSRGCAWCGWAVTRAWQNAPGVDAHRLCCFDPVADRIRFYDAGLPNPDGSYGYAKVEGLFNLGPGRLYASAANGSLYRVDLDTGMGTYLGTPVADRRSRLASLALGPDGAAYGVTGRDGECQVMRFDPATQTWELLGPVVDGDARCWQVHDVAVAADGTLYAGENDNPYRSGYLWEIAL